MGACRRRDELFDVLLKGKQLEQTMKDRQAGGGAKSGRYKKHDTARLPCLRRVAYPRLKMGILPSATDSKMLFDMPGVYQPLRAAWRARAREHHDRSFRGEPPDRNRAELTTADDERDAAGLAAETLESLAALV
ncbi:hypothetical protein SO694_0018508 [Aureococcus anophagefferens]|uniref:Uncharacterized protein n=1 Tax=Aureococcus anophagefferens TaxID=44056 RepID=A0ABR1FG62_AURAN